MVCQWYLYYYYLLSYFHTLLKITVTPFQFYYWLIGFVGRQVHRAFFVFSSRCCELLAYITVLLFCGNLLQRCDMVVLILSFACPVFPPAVLTNLLICRRKILARFSIFRTPPSQFYYVCHEILATCVRINGAMLFLITLLYPFIHMFRFIDGYVRVFSVTSITSGSILSSFFFRSHFVGSNHSLPHNFSYVFMRGLLRTSYSSLKFPFAFRFCSPF